MEIAKRIAINVGGGFVAGINAVIAGTVLAAQELGWEVVGIRDGFDGLLSPERYPDGGLVKLTPADIENVRGQTGCVLGTSPRIDPFSVRAQTADEQVEELDRSDELLNLLRKENIHAVISVVGARSLGTLWKLSRKGLKVVCIPKSIENDVAGTMLAFGFNSALSFLAEMLDRARQAAQSARRIAVVEVPGERAGWLALQAGLAAGADAILIPEIPYDLRKVAEQLRKKAGAGRQFGLIVAAEGATPITSAEGPAGTDSQMKAALSPGATGPESAYVIERSGRVATQVALGLQRLTDQEARPLVLGPLARGGAPTVVDRQLGVGYGASAVRSLNEHQSGVMVIFQPPDLKLVPMTEALNKFRIVPKDSEFVRITRTLGISLGD